MHHIANRAEWLYPKPRIRIQLCSIFQCFLSNSATVFLVYSASSHTHTSSLYLPHPVPVCVSCTLERYTLLRCYLSRYLHETAAVLWLPRAEISLLHAGNQQNTILHSPARPKHITSKYTLDPVSQAWISVANVFLFHVVL